LTSGLAGAGSPPQSPTGYGGAPGFQSGGTRLVNSVSIGGSSMPSAGMGSKTTLMLGGGNSGGGVNNNLGDYMFPSMPGGYNPYAMDMMSQGPKVVTSPPGRNHGFSLSSRSQRR